MPQTPLDSRMTCVVADNAFTTDELDRIERLGDSLTQQQADLAGSGFGPGGDPRIRITRTAWVPGTAETKWLYDRIHGVMMSVNRDAYQFELKGFTEQFQYTVYHGSEGGHYDWHLDLGMKAMQRKLSLSLQLSDPASYEGCDLQFMAGHGIETAPRDRGTVIVFPSYTLHRVTPVTAGTRKSLVAWAGGPKFR